MKTTKTTKTTNKAKTTGITQMEAVGIECALIEQARHNAKLAADLLERTMCNPDANLVNVVTGESRQSVEELLHKSLRVLISATPDMVAKEY